MGSLFNFINIPLGYVMRFLAELLGGNFAASVFAFTLLIDLLLIPLTIKSQKSTVAQLRVKPKLDELKKRYGDDRKKFAAAQQELYQKEGVSMAGGCLPMLVRLVLLFAIYSLILSPLTYMSGADKTKVNNVTNAVAAGMEELKEKDADKYEEIAKKISWNSSSKNSGNQLGVIKVVRDDTGIIEEILDEKEYEKIKDDLEAVREKDKKAGINYTLFGVDLTNKPSFNIDIFHHFEAGWLLPIGAFLAQMLMSLVSAKINKINNPEAPSMMGMMLFVPIISLFIGFTFPGGVCFYWICSSLIGGAIQAGVQVFYGPQRLLARQREKELGKQCEFEEKQLLKFDGEKTETEN